ncbi:hypothetical protein [Cupriavidus sp. DF5525]|uniref:hypothetical protein n=1 Tax=Cupriavidus sp. DF5525 TaxID=3160989 RepID=UPI0032E00A4E
MALTTFGNQTSGGTGVQMPPGNNKAVCRFQDSNATSVAWLGILESGAANVPYQSGV